MGQCTLQRRCGWKTSIISPPARGNPHLRIPLLGRHAGSFRRPTLFIIGIQFTDFVTTGVNSDRRNLIRRHGLFMGRENVGKGVNVALGPFVSFLYHLVHADRVQDDEHWPKRPERP
ncbi:hypothetical protein DFH09DRAFT_1160344 [Mycena vulgaris]|nr:hypothetical protein DFH09DRAFT_1160344 [Mycena vulgaris]